VKHLADKEEVCPQRQARADNNGKKPIFTGGGDKSYRGSGPRAGGRLGLLTWDHEENEKKKPNQRHFFPQREKGSWKVRKKDNVAMPPKERAFWKKNVVKG